ncbi:hypothetical protein G7Z17_g1423 [Cylindrodendrum hubeiense]|uniref:Aminoglycoside phosphotransferase domain-containing protein n=1 Tax=Cylindrodendrum hubeiense TaxID=595255 RepID=A0A9P5HJN1_9HYPO|nr:hypothetical protein G7Z17_g1423 [Cylindrodendrum hubeiense]
MPIAYNSPIDRLRSYHTGTEGLAINDTFFRRFVTLLALKTTAHLFSRNGVCIPISKHKIVKTGPVVHLAEGATIKYVADNTSIPVPKIYCSFVWRNRAYIVMEKVQGEAITRAWPRLSEDNRQTIFAHLKLLIQELRTLKPQGPGLKSCTGGSLRDSRIPRAFPRFGPFTSIQEFHLWLRDGLQPSEAQSSVSDQEWREVQEMATRQDGEWPPPVFTHADLNPANIFVRGDQVVGIIDWEFSGWYPHYWEYTSAWCGNVTTTEWQDVLHNFLEPFPAELEMEKTRQKWWGE